MDKKCCGPLSIGIVLSTVDDEYPLAPYHGLSLIFGKNENLVSSRFKKIPLTVV